MSTAAEAGGSRSTSRLLVGDEVLSRLESLVDEIVAGHRVGTVLLEVSNLPAKLAVDRRSELVATAHREGLLGADESSAV